MQEGDSSTIHKSSNKIGAIICTKLIQGTNQLEYEAKLFIKDVPHDFTDDELKTKVEPLLIQLTTSDCNSLLIRSDINATTNEITEQFKGLNNDADKAKIISFNEI